MENVQQNPPLTPPKRGIKNSQDGNKKVPSWEGIKGWGAANKMIELVGESPTLTIVRSGQVVISGIEGGNNLYESPEVNGQSARQEA